jgi:hypothetical protein
MRIALQLFLNQQCKTWPTTPHIRVTGRKPDANATGKRNHRRSRTASTRRERFDIHVSVNPNTAATADINLNQSQSSDGSWYRAPLNIRHRFVGKPAVIPHLDGHEGW